MTKRVVNLYRVSSEKQGSEEDIPMQRKECRAYAEQQGWVIVEEIVEKVSGFNTPIDQREDLAKIRELASQRAMDVVLVYYSDRLGRQTEMVGIVTGLAERGVELYSTKEGKISVEEHGDTLMTFIRFWQAEGESRKTSERVIDAIEQYNEEGLFTGGMAPYGYKIVDTGQKINLKKSKTLSKLVPDEEESEVVKMIFDLVINENMGGSKIAKRLNELEYTNRGKIFRQNTITRMLRNPIYMGYKRYNAFIKVGVRSKKRRIASREEWKLQPFNEEIQIVSIEDFNKAQSIMDARKTRDSDEGCNNKISTSSKYTLLSGLLQCHCGKNVTSDISHKKRVRKDGSIYEHYSGRYRCKHASNIPDHGKRYWGSTTVDKTVENEVLKTMRSIDFDEIERDISKHKSEQSTFLTKELNNVDTQLKKKKLALNNTENELEKLMMGESKFTEDQLSTLLNKLKNDVAELTSKRSEIEYELNKSDEKIVDLVAFKNQYKDWVETYINSSHERKQAMLSSVINKVILNKNGEIELHMGLNYIEDKNVSAGKVDIEGVSFVKRCGL